MGSISTGVHCRQDTQGRDVVEGRGVVEGRFSDSPGIAQQVHRNETDEDWDRRTGNRHRHGTAQPAQGLETSKDTMGRAQVKLLPAPSHTHLTCFPAADSRYYCTNAELASSTGSHNPRKTNFRFRPPTQWKWRNASRCLQCFVSLYNQTSWGHEITGIPEGAGRRQRLDVEWTSSRKVKSNLNSHLSVSPSSFSSGKRTIFKADIQGHLSPQTFPVPPRRCCRFLWHLKLNTSIFWRGTLGLEVLYFKCKGHCRLRGHKYLWLQG